MATLNDEIKNALLKKMEHPDDDVKCPLCGCELLVKEYDKGMKVYCKNDEDVHMTLRGI